MDISKSAPVRFIVRAIGWCLLILTVVLGVYLLMAVGITAITGDPITGAVVLGLLITAGAALVRWQRRGWLAYEPTPEPLSEPGRFWWQVAGCTLLAFLAGQALGLWLYSAMGSAGFDEQNSQRAAAGITALILVLVTAPLSEEALFRGLLYPLLRRRVGIRTSVVLSAAAFALLHGNTVQIASALPLAVLMALVYERTRMLWPLMLAHLAFNLVALLLPAVWVAPLANPLAAMLLGIAFGVSAAGLLSLRGTSEPGHEARDEPMNL